MTGFCLIYQRLGTILELTSVKLPGTGSSEEPTPSTPDPETPQNDNEFIGGNGGNFTWNE